MALSRLLIILLDNAMKYSPEQTQITLRAAKVKTHLVLEVRDEGCGISDEDKQKIFDRFFRVDKARSRSQGGLGLGLSLALAIYVSMAAVSRSSTTSRGELSYM